MSHRWHHGPLAAQHTERAFDTFGTACLCLMLLLLVLALAGCARPRTPAGWLDRRDLAAVAHCPPPALGRGESDACQHLAWDFRR